MPKLSTEDYQITINGTDFSDHLAGIDLNITKSSFPAPAFGQGFTELVTGKMKSATCRLAFQQDFGAASVDAVIWPLATGTGRATVVAKPTSGAVSGTNPAYTAVCDVTQYSPISGNFGQLSTFDVTWPVSGTVGRGTA